MAKQQASLRQKKLAKILLENNGKMSISKAMDKVGFGKGYSKNPQLLTKTKSWKDLMKQYLSDDILAKKHSELLNSQKIFQQYFNYKIKDNDIKKLFEDQGFTFIGTKRFMTTAVVFYLAPNTEAQDKALDKAYKLRGKYAAEKIDLKGKYSDLSNKDLADKINKLKGFLLKK